MMKTLTIAVLWTFFTAPAWAQLLTTTPLIVSDDPVPGRPGETYSSDRYALNGDQSLVFATTSVGTTGLWARTDLDSPFFPVVEAGDIIDGVTIPRPSLQPHQLSASGDFSFVFQTVLVVGNINRGEVSVVAEVGQSAPGTGSEFFRLSNIRNIDQEPVVFQALLADQTRALFEVVDGAAQLFNLPSGTAGGATISNERLEFSNDGVVALTAVLDDDETPVLLFGPIGSNGPQIVVRAGDVVPSEPNFIFTSLSLRTITDDGGVIFQATVEDQNVSPVESRNGFFHYDPLSGVVSKIVREGDPAVGIDGATLNFLSDSRVSRRGHIYFHNTFTDSDGGRTFNAWLAQHNQPLQLLGRLGLDADEEFLHGLHEVINSSGLVAFTGDFENQSTGADDTALVVAGADRVLRTILREGETIESNGVSKTISFMSNLGLATRGPYQALTDEGRLGINLNFDDGSGGLFTIEIGDVLFADGFESSD